MLHHVAMHSVDVIVVGTSTFLFSCKCKWHLQLDNACSIELHYLARIRTFMQKKDVYLSRKLAQPEGAQLHNRHVRFPL